MVRSQIKGFFWSFQEICAVLPVVPSADDQPLVALDEVLLHDFKESADIISMKTSPALHQFAWLFTRGDQSVRLLIHEQEDAIQLVVNGPGSAQVCHDFKTMTSLMSFVATYQDQLEHNQFKLQASAERRRNGRDRSGLVERRHK